MKGPSVLTAACVALTAVAFSESTWATENKTVRCPKESVQSAINSSDRDDPLTIRVISRCNENVTITRDDVTIEGVRGGAVNGTINVFGARRIVIRNMILTGPGDGLNVTDGGTVSVEDSKIQGNDTDGVAVTNGAVVKILNNEIRNNGKNSGSDQGRGVLVNNSGSAEIVGNTVEENRSDGIGVFNDSFALVVQNQIRKNGRPSVFEAGLQVSRAQVRANGNIYEENPYAAIEVFNFGSYRTGSFLTGEDMPDNEFPFEQIDAGSNGLAVDIGQASYVDLRQVTVNGNINVGFQSMLQMRGDNVGPVRICSQVNGDIGIFGINSTARIRDTIVNGEIFGGPFETNGCPFFTPALQ